ncbi:MAG: hypothetical protein HQL10_07720 [Nitrospirae bacterium]|nr:hypothetical protein [Nitrospirota bacterium]
MAEFIISASVGGESVFYGMEDRKKFISETAIVMIGTKVHQFLYGELKGQSNIDLQCSSTMQISFTEREEPDTTWTYIDKYIGHVCLSRNEESLVNGEKPYMISIMLKLPMRYFRYLCSVRDRVIRVDGFFDILKEQTEQQKQADVIGLVKNIKFDIE